MQGLKFADYLKHLNKTAEQMKLEFVPQAIKRVKGALLTRAIFLQEKMEIPESEVDKELEAAGQMYKQYPDMLKNLRTPQYREYIRNLIANRKVMDFLKAICVERTDPEHKH
jgi:FKBP-type peptidyl-prolyl cis-trans isomerase (trigger factor)